MARKPKAATNVHPPSAGGSANRHSAEDEEVGGWAGRTTDWFRRVVTALDGRERGLTYEEIGNGFVPPKGKSTVAAWMKELKELLHMSSDSDIGPSGLERAFHPAVEE